MFYQNVSAFYFAQPKFKKYYHHVTVLAQFQLLCFNVYGMLHNLQISQYSSCLEEGVDRL